MTVEGYVQFWLGLCGGGLILGCVVAWLLVRSMTKELAALRMELARMGNYPPTPPVPLRPGLTFLSGEKRNLITRLPKKAKR